MTSRSSNGITVGPIYRTARSVNGECFPSYDEIAKAAGCCRATVAAKLRILEQHGFIETIRRKAVATFTHRASQVCFDVAMQTSNSYTFSLPPSERAEQGDAALPLLGPNVVAESATRSAPGKAESKFRTETSRTIKKIGSEQNVADLNGEKARWTAALLANSKTGCTAVRAFKRVRGVPSGSKGAAGTRRRAPIG
jgi:uncharacterized phage protein gp47/JayE